MIGITILGVVAIFAILAAFLIARFNPSPLPEEVICERLIPGVKEVGLKFSRAADGGVDVGLNGKVSTSQATAELVDKILECVGSHNSMKIVHAVNLDLEPIGQVADHWKGDRDLRLKLMPGGDMSILNNLRIGPVVGKKQEVMREWCGPSQAGNCVKCSPSEPTEDTQYVEISLLPNPPVERQQMPGTWNGAGPGGKLEPWQLAEPDGRRYLYRCKH